MTDDNELSEGELTAEEILTFGACIEAAVWTPMWLQESRAPIAVAAGKPKFGPIFNSDGVGKAVVIRPCVSRGRRIRGLPPIYTPQMLEANSSVYDGWPMFMDHVPPELAERLAKYGRSVKDLGGQILKGWYQRDFTQASDGDFGYRPGATLAEIWAAPVIRNTVGQNPNLLHTSINAWPKSGKPGTVPWNTSIKGMVIEGIRRVPAGSVDFVVRGGAGGKLLAQEGLDGEGAWPEAGVLSSDDEALVVSVCESLYASGEMTPLPTDPAKLKEYLEAEAPHLLPALAEGAQAPTAPTAPAPAPAPAPAAAPAAAAPPSQGTQLTETDVNRLIESARDGQPTVEEFEATLKERAEEMIEERETQRHLAGVAHALIEAATGIPATWKADLKARYAMLPSGPSQALLVEAEMDGQKVVKDVETVLKEAVTADLDHSRGLIADVKGKPRVTGEGGSKPDAAGGEKTTTSKTQEGDVAFWAERFASMGIAESAEHAIEVYGGKVEG